jgi:glycosyltransferase involved in cell wall biosynthesis
MNTEHTISRRPRVLQLSYACSPLRGSEPSVGWHRAVQSAKHFDTWVICEEHEFGGEIRRYLDAHGEIPGLHFVFVPINQREWSWGQIHDSLWYMVLRRWHWQAFRVAQRLHKELDFDLVHLVTFCGYREPSYLWRLGPPFVWGPIGGVQDYPWRFLPYAGIKGAMQESLRSVANNMQLRFSPRVRRAARKAAVVLAANTMTQDRFGRAHGITMPILPDVAIDAVAESPRSVRHDGPIRLLWSGLLVHRKALHLLIRALARLPADVRYELRVLGEGRLKQRWQRLAEKMGVAEHITWLGWLPHSEAKHQYAWADAFVFSSLRDTTGTVVVEALAAGLPVICLDHQGVQDVVTDQCGLKIPVTTPRRVIAALSDAIARLSRDHALWQDLSRGAVDRARQYLWSRHEEQLIALYRRILNDKRGTAGVEGQWHNGHVSLPATSSFVVENPHTTAAQTALH